MRPFVVAVALIAGGCGGAVQQRAPEPEESPPVTADVAPDATPADEFSTAGDPDEDGFEDDADLCPFYPGTDQGCPSEVCRTVTSAVDEIASNFEDVRNEELSANKDGRIVKHSTYLQVPDGTCVIERVHAIGVFLLCELIETGDETVAEAGYRAWIDKLGTCRMDGWSSGVEAQRDNTTETSWAHSFLEQRITLTKLYDKHWEEMGRTAYTVYFRIGKS